MKKLVYTLITLMVLAVFLVGCTTIVPETDLLGKGHNGQEGNSNIAHLYLYEKVPGTWEIVEDGAWGTMQYNLSGEEFEFVFNGHGLEAGEDYTLIYYSDPWPGNDLICLGEGTANKGGNVNIVNSLFTGALPIEGDTNDGAKIWLVLSDDVDCDNQLMVGWNPTEYLFEEELITFDAVFNGTVSGIILTDDFGVVSGDLSGDFNLTVLGQVTQYINHIATFSGTVTGDIVGDVNAKISDMGIDTLQGIISGTGAGDPVRFIGTFQTGVAGEFTGEIITGPELPPVTGLTIAGSDTVAVGKN